MHLYSACKIFDRSCIHSVIRWMRKHVPPHQKMFFELELKNPFPLLPEGTVREQTAREKTDMKKSTSAFPASSTSRHSQQSCPPSGASTRCATWSLQWWKVPSSGVHHHHHCTEAIRPKAVSARLAAFSHQVLPQLPSPRLHPLCTAVVLVNSKQDTTLLSTGPIP